MENDKRERLKMDDPATYLICVQGCLEEIWADRFAGMTIEMDLKNQQVPVSILRGRIRDQSELLGVLNGLYQMRVPILHMEVIDGAFEVPESYKTKYHSKGVGI